MHIDNKNDWSHKRTVLFLDFIIETCWNYHQCIHEFFDHLVNFDHYQPKTNMSVKADIRQLFSWWINKFIFNLLDKHYISLYAYVIMCKTFEACNMEFRNIYNCKNFGDQTTNIKLGLNPILLFNRFLSAFSGAFDMYIFMFIRWLWYIQHGFNVILY